jgi:hypothetical protein
VLSVHLSPLPYTTFYSSLHPNLACRALISMSVHPRMQVMESNLFLHVGHVNRDSHLVLFAVVRLFTFMSAPPPPPGEIRAPHPLIPGNKKQVRKSRRRKSGNPKASSAKIEVRDGNLSVVSRGPLAVSAPLNPKFAQSVLYDEIRFQHKFADPDENLEFTIKAGDWYVPPLMSFSC